MSSERSALQISENNLAMFVCSFLNNGMGGTIFYGINANGIVEGMKLNRLERDTFRKGIDRMMGRSIYPEVRPSCYDVSFIPVMRSGGKILALSAHRTWVIEIQIKALPHVVYTMASNHKCYVRQGTKCVEGIALTLRQDPAEQAKKEIEKAVQEFKAQIPVAKEKLVMFVRDYLRKTNSSEFESL
ncbi:hypothetical protein J437_LFUL007904 [Ladona fulva]|uniref:Schlafen AlbA-2 domain-containing protein n=1 Tax=Ladona fulva TaxID=123851 RepID=A0A8K0P3K1_LADFU|nr:hypothetical protein J437_LFUL007904 [Ladona fulva]